jgi:solute carrier family 25 folate transporter 32
MSDHIKTEKTAIAEEEIRQRPPIWVTAVAGMLSGATTAFFTAPLDLIKTQQMALKTTHSMGEAISRIVAKDGLLGLYRGLGLTMMGLMPTWAVYWFCYNSLKRIQVDKLSRKADGVTTHLFAAMGAGIATTVSTNPIWVIKTRLQTQSLKLDAAYTRYSSIPHAAITIWRQEGARSFFRGVVPSLLGVTHVCVQFPLYEQFKLHFAEKGNKTTKELTFGELIMASMASKVVASTAAFPHEVLRVRQQVQRSAETSIFKLAKETYQKEGFRGFYRGLGTNLLRVVPAAAITFVSFEYISRGLSRLTNRK